MAQEKLTDQQEEFLHTINTLMHEFIMKTRQLNYACEQQKTIIIQLNRIEEKLDATQQTKIKYDPIIDEEMPYNPS